MPGGRPTKYSETILAQTTEYIESCNDGWKVEWHDEVKIKDGISEVVQIPEAKYKVKVPTLEGLAYHLHVHKDTIQEWKKQHEEFSVLIDDLLAKQAEALVNNGLSGDYNPTIAKVLLTKHGYVDKQETDMTSKGDKIDTVLVKFLDDKDNRDTQGV